MGIYEDWKFRRRKSKGGASTSETPCSSSETSVDFNKAQTEKLFDNLSFEGVKSLLDILDKEFPIEPEGEASAPQQSSEKNALPVSVNRDLTDIQEALDKATTSCQDLFNAKGGPVKDISKESYKIFVKTLNKVGNLHWAAAGFSVVAVVLKRADLTGTNGKKCMDLWSSLRKVGRRLLDVYPQLPYDHDRFLLAGGIEDKLQALEKQIDDWYRDMQSDSTAELLRRKSIPLPSSIPKDPPNAVGLGEKVSKLMKILGLEERNLIKPGARAVNLNGIGGIGKSTLGMALSEQAIHAFGKDRCHARVEVGESPTQEKICKLQRNILEMLSSQSHKIADCTEGRQMLKKYFKERRDPILLFIDNIFKPDPDLEMLLPDELGNILNHDSRIIITSRSNPTSVSQILDEKGMDDCHEYAVPELEDVQAQKLLCRHVFSSEIPPPGKESLVASVLKRCGGLPLALEVVGKYLRNRRNDDQEWRKAIGNLESFLTLDGSKESKLSGALMFSYSELSPTYQVAFLDIACLFRGSSWNVVKTCIGELNNLEKWGLVKRSQHIEYANDFLDEEDVEGETVLVHDLLVALAQRELQNQRDVAQAKFPDDAWELPLSRILVTASSYEELPFPLRAEDDESLCSHLEAVVIRGSSYPYLRRPIISAKKLNAMHKLRLLILEKVKVQGKYTNLSKGLQVCMIGDIVDRPTAFTHLNKLRVLSISYWLCEASFGQLPTSCEVLYLQYAESMKFFPEAFPNGSSLHTVSISWCSGFKELPGDFCGLLFLRRLTLSLCRSLQGLPVEFGRLKALEYLDLKGSTGLKELPNSLRKLTALQELDLTGCEDLTNLPDDFGDLKSLKRLHLKYCRGLQGLPPGFGGLGVLEDLDLTGCDGLEELPMGFGDLAALRELNLEGCSGLKELPIGFGKLAALQKLFLKGCEFLKEVPEDFGGLTALRKLDLTGCKGLKELPIGFGGLAALKWLKLVGCESLKQLPEGFGQLTALKYLDLNGCTGLSEIPEDFLQRTNSRELSGRGCHFEDIYMIKELIEQNCATIEWGSESDDSDETYENDWNGEL